MPKNDENTGKSKENNNSPFSTESVKQLRTHPNSYWTIIQPQSSAGAGPEAKESVLSGSFNPLHVGHLEMANVAKTKLGRCCWFELSIANADKNSLLDHQIAERLNQDFGEHGLVLSQAATFVEKSALFPGTIFVVGADTIVRINELKYYGSDQSQFDYAMRQIADNGCQFLVFARKIGNKLVDRQNISLGKNLLSLCRFVDRSEFENDVSSTQIRELGG